MNNEFPRILSLIRKEKQISQKKAAFDLGIAQALLSHYEKGKRECGLDFLIRAADYYNVSTDYLLGRSAVSNGAVISVEEIPESERNSKNTSEQGSLTAILSKKLIINSIEIIFSLLAHTKNPKLVQNISNILSLAVYRVFRLVYRINPRNDKNLFSIDEEMAYRSANAASLLAEGKAVIAISEEASESISAMLTTPTTLTTAYLETEYQKQATALLNLVRNCEAIIKKQGKDFI